MNHRDFSIGLEFWCGDKRWRCTDVGKRVITAICLEPRNMVRSEVDPNDKMKRIQTKFVSTDPRDLNGPPYGVAEIVFDEYDMKGCSLEREDSTVSERELLDVAQVDLQNSKRNVLFVCNKNQWRSPTAENVWRRHPSLNVRSGGTSPSARRTVSIEDIVWADVILVMEEKHKSRLKAEYARALQHKLIHVLDIPDD